MILQMPTHLLTTAICSIAIAMPGAAPLPGFCDIQYMANGCKKWICKTHSKSKNKIIAFKINY